MSGHREPDTNGSGTKRRDPSIRQLLAGVAGAGAFLSFLLVCTLFRDVEFVRNYLIGPYGASAGMWLVGFFLAMRALAAWEARGYK